MQKPGRRSAPQTLKAATKPTVAAKLFCFSDHAPRPLSSPELAGLTKLAHSKYAAGRIVSRNQKCSESWAISPCHRDDSQN
ncbi:MAG: hypothetical protein YYHSYBAR_002547 [Candidatus Fervidibacter sacchari]